jgi:hypothetical protein
VLQRHRPNQAGPPRSTLARLPENRFSLRHSWVLAEYAEGLRRANRIAEGLQTIGHALEMCRRDEEFWCIAELLRIKGELLLSERRPSADRITAERLAEQLFHESLDWARRQEALSWELRTSLSLARLRQQQGFRREAHDVIAAVYGRFTEGLATVDLRTAKALIDELAATNG